MAFGMMAAGGVQASSEITWGAVRNITGDADVSTEGTSVLAANFCAIQDITVNGVTFSGGGDMPDVNDSSVYGDALVYQVDRAHNTAFTSAEVPFRTLSENYKILLGGGVYNLARALSDDMTFNKLIPGQTYQLQVWASDPRTFIASTYANLTMTIDGAVTLDMNVGDQEGGCGQYVIGTFTADETGSQTIRLKTTKNCWTINALQLRAVSNTPKPLGLITG